MKVFYTPAINGEYDFKAQRRLPDIPDNKAYAVVGTVAGQPALDELDDRGYTKILDRADDRTIKGYWTYQQDSL